MGKANSVKDGQSFKKKVMVKVFKNDGWKIEVKQKKGGEMGKGADSQKEEEIEQMNVIYL